MTGSILLVICLGILGQTETVPASPSSDAEIRAAIRQLGDNRFAVRQRATDLLWQAGEAAEKPLKDSLASPDPEVRYRAALLLENFRLGIFADTPDDVVRLIRRFRDSDSASRRDLLVQMLNAGHVKPALRLVSREEQPAARQELARSLADHVERVAPQLLLEGQSAQLDELLSLAAVHDQGLLRYAMYLAVRGTLEPKLQDVEAEVARTNDRDARRRLCFFQRAKGDLVAAVRTAETLRMEQPELLRGLLTEARDWKRLAELNQEAADDQDIEQLGFRAAYQRLAGDDQAFTATLEAIRKRAAMPNEEWFAAEALLCNGRTDEGIRLMSKSKTPEAFRLLCEQTRYREAFELFGVEVGGSYEKWFAQVLADTRSKTEKRDRFRWGLEFARTMLQVGKKDLANNFFTKLAQAVKDDEDGHRNRLRMVIDQEIKSGLRDLAFEHASWGLNEQSAASLLRTLYPKQGEAAEKWWQLLQRRTGPLDLPVLLGRLRDVMETHPHSQMTPEKLDELLVQAKSFFPQPRESEAAAWLVVLGETCLTHKQRPRAVGYFEQAGATSAAAALRAADLHVEDENWPAAADWYWKSWQLDKSQALALYLHGHALGKQGRGDEQRKHQDLAVQIPLQSRSRHAFADGLRERGLADDALRQWELLLRTGGLGEWYVNDASNKIGNAINQRDELRAAACWETLLLSVLSRSSQFIEMSGYLQLPDLIHRTRARGAIKAGRPDDAVHELRRALAAKPGNVNIAEDFVVDLERLGRAEPAEELFEAVRSTMQRTCDDFPESALHLNNLAWLMARCNRRLDEALTLSQRAVALQPQLATYLDTLAECHFRLGHREDAIRLAKQCLELEPKSTFFREQLARFEGPEKP